MPRQSLRGVVAFVKQSGMVTHSDEAISLLRVGIASVALADLHPPASAV